MPKQDKLELKEVKVGDNPNKTDRDSTQDQFMEKLRKSEAKEQRKALKKEAARRAKVAAQAQRIEARALRENWYKLDNSALIYPAIDSSEWNSVFRLSVTLKETVDVLKLQHALDDTLKRYPFFNVSLRDGLFWHYFQSLTFKPEIEEEHTYPCRPFAFDKKSQIFRVLYFHKKISFESFHSLADGGGALQFFNTLLVRYMQLKGVEIKDVAKYNLNALDLPDEQEREDAFKRYADGTKTQSRKENRAYALKGDVEPIEVLHAYTGIAEVAELKALGKTYNATVNELLSAVYLKVMIDEKLKRDKNNKRPVKLSVPVNLRKMFPTATMRNFSQIINIEVPVDKQNGTLEELIDLVKEQSAVATPENMMEKINSNVKSERNFFVRLLPLFIKDFMLKIIYANVGETQFTSTLSNLGLVKLPPEVEERIENYYALLGATKLNKINLCVVSMGKHATLTFTSRFKDARVAREFFTYLSGLGLKLTIESNV